MSKFLRLCENIAIAVVLLWAMWMGLALQLWDQAIFLLCFVILAVVVGLRLRWERKP